MDIQTSNVDKMLGLWTRCWACERDVGPVHEMLDLKTGLNVDE